MITIEVVYDNTKTQKMITLQVPMGTSLEKGIIQSGILECFPEIDLTQNKVGLFGEIAQLTQILNHHDRIEIYRPLFADPKQARLNRIKNSEC